MIEMTQSETNIKELILMTPYYIEPNKNDPMRIRMDEYGEIMKEQAKYYNLGGIDLQHEFDEYLHYRYSATLTWDRVHPGWIGSFIIAKAFLKQIEFDRKII